MGTGRALAKGGRSLTRGNIQGFRVPKGGALFHPVIAASEAKQTSSRRNG
jgi:hypothetical protein